MRLPLTIPPRPAAQPRRTPLLSRAGSRDGTSVDLVEQDGRAMRVSVDAEGDRLRFRVALDAACRPRLVMDMPPRVLGAAASIGVAVRLDAFLRGPAGEDAFACLVSDAAACEIRFRRSGARSAALSMLASDLVTWRAMPAEARSPLGAFLARSGSGMPEPFDAATLPAILHRAGSAAGLMMSGSPTPLTFPSDPCLAGLMAAVERARALGVRSTRHVCVGMDASEAPRIADIPSAVSMDDFVSQAAARHVSAEDLVVVTCAAPASEGLSGLLRVLSRYGIAARLVVVDPEEALVSLAPPLSRALGIPVGA